MSSKPQLGWRKDNADEVLYTPMFRLGYELKIHLAKHEKWNHFQSQLYQQNGFLRFNRINQTPVEEPNRNVQA